MRSNNATYSFFLQRDTGLLTLGTPLFPHMTLRHAGGTLTILAPGVSPQRCVVRSVSVNGQRWKGSTIPISKVLGGDVTIEFKM